MKRFITIAASFVLVICLLSCSYKGTYDDGHEDGFDYGFDCGWYKGYDEGYSEGLAEAQHDIAIRVDDEIWSLAWDIEDEYGLFPEDALQILTNYADVPDEVTREEVNNAIWAIRRYYFASNEIINDIEDYWID